MHVRCILPGLLTLLGFCVIALPAHANHPAIVSAQRQLTNATAAGTTQEQEEKAVNIAVGRLEAAVRNNPGTPGLPDALAAAKKAQADLRSGQSPDIVNADIAQALRSIQTALASFGDGQRDSGKKSEPPADAGE